MKNSNKSVTYISSNSYQTRNAISPSTKNIWMVFHGMGYLSRYFLKYFDVLSSEENYIIAPQAPSKYYLNESFKHVGASWLTREDTETEIENVLNYVHSVWETEAIETTASRIVFGFSQGVSVALRWVAKKRIACEILVLYAGAIPKELTEDDLEFLIDNGTKVLLVYGDKDPYLSEERIKKEIQKAKLLFKASLEVIPFQGGHEMRSEILRSIAG